MISKKNIDTLLAVNQPNCVSIFIPTYRAGNAQEDQLRFKNAINEARDYLVKYKAMNQAETKKHLRPAYQLLSKPEFWMHLSDGLAVFITEDYFEYFICPIKFNNFVYLDTQFYLRPLLTLINSPNRFFLLALSQNQIRFFDCNQFSITPVIIEDLVPQNMEEALFNDNENRKSLQAHTAATGFSILHGQGTGRDNVSKDLKRYFRIVDNGLMEMLHDEKAPMILATVDYQAPMYREVSRYINVMNFNISGNPENDDPVLLHEKAWLLMKGYFQKQLDHHARFELNLAQSKATSNLEAIVIAANEGRIETVYLNKSEHLWGAFNKNDRSLALHQSRKDENLDILEFVAKKTYENGGTVYQMQGTELPNEKAPASAILRF